MERSQIKINLSPYPFSPSPPDDFIIENERTCLDDWNERDLQKMLDAGIRDPYRNKKKHLFFDTYDARMCVSARVRHGFEGDENRKKQKN